MKYRYALSTVFEFSEPVTGHVFRVRPVPAQLPGQNVIETHLVTSPMLLLACTEDSVLGNLTWTGRIDEPHGSFTIASKGIVESVDALENDMPPAPYFVYSTALTRPGKKILEFWERLRPQLGIDVGQKAQQLMHAVHQSFEYRPGATGTRTTAEDAMTLGAGVCQDYSHVLIALLRLAGIPALYVAGLVHGTGATHAWVHAWVKNRWLALDPTHDCLAHGAYVALARGCDFQDAALERGVFLGSASQTIKTQAVVEPIE